MTISPPANVKNDSVVYASGIDTLVLAIDAVWENETVFRYLEVLKDQARHENSDYSGILMTADDSLEFPFDIKPHGTDGYAWLISNKEYVLKIGNWTAPKSRPSLMVEIKSETLWRRGVNESLEWIAWLLEGVGAHLQVIKPSRVDLCLDLCLPVSIWSMAIMDYAVTRADDYAPYFKDRVLTGISIGKGHIQARLYDKALEILQKSKKYWMYVVWGLDALPEQKRMIRIEYQIRREILKELGIENITDLHQKLPNLWSYCTRKWLKFQDQPGKHHTARKTLEWWQIVQDGFQGVQDAEPLIREKAYRQDKKQLTMQTYGLLTSLKAAELEQQEQSIDKTVRLEECFNTLRRELIFNGKNSNDMNERIIRKRARHHRAKTK